MTQVLSPSLLPSPPNRFLFDLETMGTGPRAVIVQIGAVVIGSDGPEEGTEFSVNVCMNDGIKHGLAVDAKTIQWWMSQSEAARAALFDPKPELLRVALRKFRQWHELHAGKNSEAWSHATFDAVILNSSYGALRQPSPIHFRQTRDLRTLYGLANPVFDRTPTDTDHIAIEDCRFHARLVAESLARISVEDPS